MLSLNSVESIIATLSGMGGAIELVAQGLNTLPTVFATSFPGMCLATSIASQCHPLTLHTYKPIVTTGDGNCLYHALSRTVCGSEQLSNIFRLLIAYSLVKYRDVMIRSLQDAFPLQSHGEHVCKSNALLIEALQLARWGSDYHNCLDITILT